MQTSPRLLLYEANLFVDNTIHRHCTSIPHTEPKKLTQQTSVVTEAKTITSPMLQDVRARKKKVLPGIEPGLPEDTEVIRIRSDNRYLGGISYLD
jgi:hypothetical protein